MGEGKPVSTPATRATTTGSATETHGANTNLDPNMQGGPVSSADQAAAREVEEEHAEQGAPAASQPADQNGK